jgi:hypothetical protein
VGRGINLPMRALGLPPAAGKQTSLLLHIVEISVPAGNYLISIPLRCAREHVVVILIKGPDNQLEISVEPGMEPSSLPSEM